MKTLIARLFFCASVLFFVACTDAPDAPLTVKAPSATPQQRAVIKEASKVLFDACRGLEKYAGDIKEITASVGEIGTRNVGWKTGIDFAVTISDNPKKIPSKWYAKGHRLSYTMVGGRRPGIDIGKPTAGWFCSVGKTSPFIDEPKAAVVDKVT